MINSVNLATYYKVARISQSLNRFMREAAIAKSQVNSSLSSTLSSQSGIGKNIDILA